jgi:hypothetical protein
LPQTDFSAIPGDPAWEDLCFLLLGNSSSFAPRLNGGPGLSGIFRKIHGPKKVGKWCKMVATKTCFVFTKVDLQFNKTVKNNNKVLEIGDIPLL